MPYVKYLPENAAISDVFLSRPQTYVHLARFSEAVLRGPSPLSVAERELIAAYCSALNACRFCVGVHAATATAFGIDGALVDRLVEDPARAAVNDKLKPILAFVEKLTRSPSRVIQADADAVFAAGWEEDALHDAIAVCSLFNMYNRIVEGHGITGADKPFEAIAGFLKDHGYAGRFKNLETEKTGVSN